MIEKRGKRYRVRIKHKGRYLSSQTFARKAEAEQWERDQRSALRGGTWVDPNGGSMLMSSWVALWWPSRRPVKDSTEARYVGLRDNHILPAFGRKPLTMMRKTEIATWAHSMSRDLSASSAHQALGLLRRCLDDAVDEGLITKNPAVGITVSQSRPNAPRPLTDESLWDLADCTMTERDRMMILVAGYGGLRFGELTALSPSSVGVDGSLSVNHSYICLNGVFQLSDTKNHQSRTVPLPVQVAELLLDYVKSRRGKDLLFASSSETPLDNGNWRRDALTPASRRAGLDIVRPHDLRDTAATIAIAAGSTPTMVAAMLGHQDASVTLRHYIGFFPNDVRTVADKVSARIEAMRADRRPNLQSVD